ncbi:MAG: TRAFs-binding domain-containing protein [Chthoniobacterales bacterium]
MADLRATIRELRASSSGGLADLLTVWRSHDADAWSRRPAIYSLLGEKVLKEGEPLLAYDIVAEGMNYAPDDVRLRQLQGLALARSGANARARQLFEKLRAENNLDDETLGMLARTYKDDASLAKTRREAREFLQQAAAVYAEAYHLNGGYWTGINAATTALLVGKKREAAKLAATVRASCLRELKRTRGDKYWLLATLGEEALISRDWSQAADWYAQAGAIGRKRFGDLQSSRRNARLLLDYWKQDPAEIEWCLQIPHVIAFVGHMIDQPGRDQARFPAALEKEVAREIERRIESIGAQLSYSSAACGSDLLFLEAMLARGGEVVVVLPYGREQFVRDSVDVIPKGDWRARFDRVLARAAHVVTASRDRFGRGGVSYDYANHLVLGLARIRARRLETELSGLAVWDGAKGDGLGGTASAVNDWRHAGLHVEVIDPARILKQSRTRQNTPPTRRRKKASREIPSQIMSMLFADAVSYSALSEQQMPLFMRYFLGAIGRLVTKAGNKIVEKNTWGDGIFLVFANVQSAGEIALDLCDLIGSAPWQKHGLPESLNLRIALHAGPVYSLIDPITQKRGYVGTHVSRAARIEPVTPAGQVYASEAFAALAAAHGARGFACDYAGQTPMAKGYGTFPTYHVRRT